MKKVTYGLAHRGFVPPILSTLRLDLVFWSNLTPKEIKVDYDSSDSDSSLEGFRFQTEGRDGGENFSMKPLTPEKPKTVTVESTKNPTKEKVTK